MCKNAQPNVLCSFCKDDYRLLGAQLVELSVDVFEIIKKTTAVQCWTRNKTTCGETKVPCRGKSYRYRPHDRKMFTTTLNQSINHSSPQRTFS